MKKIYYFIASALTLTAVSCSQGGNTGEGTDTTKTEDKQQYMEDINAGQEPAAQNEVATLDDRAAVAVLADDNAFRPGTKVTRPTVLDFNATWCGPCKLFAPIFDEVAEAYGNQVDFYSVDVDVNPETSGAFEIQYIPSVIVLLPDGTYKSYVGTDSLIEDSTNPTPEKFEAIVKSYL